jgi:putative IMPACT (imprinted ancient) family translation regulator
MTSNAYRSNAENCLRMAQTASNDRDRPFWLNLAQSWLQLAEHSARAGADLGAETH